MNGFLQKLRAGLTRFMTGRHGADQLTLALIYTALALNLLAMIPYLGLLSLLSTTCLVFAVYRTFSKNNARRYAENAWFLRKFGGIPARVKQSFIRAKNMRKFAYFDCPQCHAKLRLPRGVGEVTVTCGKCKHAFRKSA